jgi:hypothetical protein
MAVTYEQDDEAGTIIATVTGPFLLDEIVGVMDRQAAEGTWKYVLLYDEREMTGVPTAADLRTLLRRVKTLVKQHGPRGPVAVLATRVDLYGVARFYSRVSKIDGDPLHVFHERAEADRWLSEMTGR